MTKSTIRLILEQLVRNFADQEEDGTWYGYDTNLGNCDETFELAEKYIRNYFND